MVRKLLNLPISVTDYVVNIHGNSGPGNEKCPVKKSTVAPFGPSIKDVWLTRGEVDLGKPDIYCYSIVKRGQAGEGELKILIFAGRP